MSVYDECERMTTTNQSGKAVLKHPIVCGECKEIENAPYDENGYNIANWISVLEDLLFDKDGNALVKYSRLAELAAEECVGCTYKQEEWEEMIFTCSHCGETWCYDCGNPFENNQNFCGHCGWPIRAIIILDRDDDYDLVEKTLTREAAEASLAGKGE